MITIIILLILAGISISVLTGGNGLFVRAKDAKDNTLIAKQKEEDITNSYYLLINSVWGESSGITAAQIMENPSEYYGKKVEYEPENGCDVDWKIFSADENNIYLIATDCVENKYLTEFEEDQKSGKYSIYTDVCAAEDLVGRLTDEIEGFKNGKANSVVSTPTLQQYCASWNALYPNNKLTVTGNDTDGYKVNEEWKVNMSDFQEGYNNTMYYPHHDSGYDGMEGVRGFWLNSISDANDSRCYGCMF